MNVYDFDNTIFKGDSTAKFYLFCLRRHKKIIFCSPSLLKAFLSYYVFKKGDKTDFKEKMFGFLRYCENIDEDIHEFWERNIKNIKKFYILQKNNDDVIISASPRFLLTPACEKLDIKYLIASEVDKKTGKYTGINCHGSEKVRRFRKQFGETEIDNFYSDSYSDTPLAEIALKAFLVKGDTITAWK